MINHELSYASTVCPQCGAQWAEGVSYRSATRWEPEEWEQQELDCPNGCKAETRTLCDGPFDAVAIAALETARAVGAGIEVLGLPRCLKCGHSIDEGWSSEYHWGCEPQEEEVLR